MKVSTGRPDWNHRHRRCRGDHRLRHLGHRPRRPETLPVRNRMRSAGVQRGGGTLLLRATGRQLRSQGIAGR